MTFWHLVRVTAWAGGLAKSVHNIVAEHDFEKAAAILMSVIPKVQTSSPRGTSQLPS
jgi:hypothetical protein